ncbi:hypothetical protein N7414_24770 [Pseudomonas sp. GD04087]|uniref:hypothetical protein n=1 Tax=unclassified Pseudomonas TaxID=196821 RepID=UPI00244B3D71|nr:MULTISPECIES: hypothetical protein [unclassified Pseudomonas]MDH0292348.1 hypothetical protein [Pseudomonas sp. GD04087]MDH1048816.1 hypothetical protein [Pseudomonas sp. GD03903]MDH2001316.1 hypothetical protein [Pseudomonas sp. GD03691]
MNAKEMAESDRLYAEVNAKIRALDEFVESNDENSPDFLPQLKTRQEALELATQRWREASKPSRFWLFLAKLFRK